MSDAETSDEKYDDGDWMLKELSADESGEPSSSNNDNLPVSCSRYLSTANETAEIVNLKKRYVENMQRLIRTCRHEVANLTTERDTAYRRLAAREASRIKPEKAEKGHYENTVLLTFKNVTELGSWIAVQRIDMEGGNGSDWLRSGNQRKIVAKGDGAMEMKDERIIIKKEMRTMSTQTEAGDDGEKEIMISKKREKEKWDDEIDDVSSEDGSLWDRKRRKRSRSREVKKRRNDDDDDNRLRRIEEAKKRKKELERQLKSQRSKEERIGRWKDGRSDRHRHL